MYKKLNGYIKLSKSKKVWCAYRKVSGGYRFIGFLYPEKFTSLLFLGDRSADLYRIENKQTVVKGQLVWNNGGIKCYAYSDRQKIWVGWLDTETAAKCALNPDPDREAGFYYEVIPELENFIEVKISVGKPETVQ